MTPRDLATEVERHKAAAAAFRRAEERAETSPNGMRDTARELRDSAAAIPDSCDRDTMLRLAAEYERRAAEAERRPRPLRTMATAWHEAQKEKSR